MKKLTLSKRKILFAWLCVLPVLLVRGFTTLYPFGTVIGYSFMDYDLIRGSKEFAGLLNFKELLVERQFLGTLRFTTLYSVVSILIIVVLGTCLALLLKQEFPGRKLLRTTVLIPWGLSMIVVSIAAKYAFDDSYGIVNDLIRRIGFEEFHFNWLSDKMGAQIAVIIVNGWKNVSFFAIIMLAALQGIPGEIIESARLDGANSFRIFFSISLPYVMRTFVTQIIFVGVSQINSFDIVYSMTQGGPGNTTSLLAYRLYMAFTKNMNFGQASAISIILFLVTSIYGLIGLSIYRKVDY